MTLHANTKMADGEKEAQKTVNKLAMAANHYTRTSSAAARFYMHEMNAIRHNFGRHPAQEEQLTCPFCHAIYRPGNYTVTLKPKMKVTKKVERLRRRQAEGVVLGRIHEKLLQHYENSHNQFVIRCESCGITDKLRGGTRNEPVLIDLRRDRERVRQKIKDTNSTPLKAKLPKLTSAMRKRKKQREKRRAESSLYDSGLPDSLTSASRTASLSLSTISSVGLDSSMSSDTVSQIWTAPSPFTSTPKASQESVAVLKQKRSPKDSFASFLSSIKGSPGSRKDSQTTQTKKNKKRKGGMGKLESLLSQQQQQESRQGKNTLINFLSSV